MLQVPQLRAARALIGWRQEDIAQAAKISVATIRRIESQEGPLAGYVSTLVKIQAAFEQAGIQFIDDDELGGFGVRMAKKKKESDDVKLLVTTKITAPDIPSRMQQDSSAPRRKVPWLRGHPPHSRRNGNLGVAALTARSTSRKPNPEGQHPFSREPLAPAISTTIDAGMDGEAIHALAIMRCTA